MSSDDCGETNPHEFDFDEWLESVDGETVRVTRPPDNALGPQVASLFVSKCLYVRTWCRECEDHHVLVKTDPDEVSGHCPICGREPGMLELGTKEPA